MIRDIGRRRVLKLAAGSAGAFLIPSRVQAVETPLNVAGRNVEVRLLSVSPFTLRIIVEEVKRPSVAQSDGAVVNESLGTIVATLTSVETERTMQAGKLSIGASTNPLSFSISSPERKQIQTLVVDAQTGSIRFQAGKARLLGLGEGGPQFDRRGSIDAMRSGQGGYRLHTHGGRVPIPWLIGTSGWALFFHQPLGTFDLQSDDCSFHPLSKEPALPLEIFITVSEEPATILSEYARFTGRAQMPPLWSLGYQQSHRTITSRDEVIDEAKMFREKKLPCDALIYLGTGFCPSGWNTANGSFVFNRAVFPDPKGIFEELHKEHFRVVLHSVILSDRLRGTVHDNCVLSEFDETRASCYWAMHQEAMTTGVDGWWPDEGDPLDVASRLNRIRMYWEGAQLDRPNERPYALHRNGYAGMQQYAPFLWSGDVYSTWETLRTHIPIGINAGLSGMPYWGTDIGGFVPTKELTGELYIRWFQFGAFCPLFRSHGRTWKLRLPWGWNTGELGPNEVSGYREATNPDASELHNTAVEPICRKYLELRYRLLPYLYSAVRECCLTGMPIIRAMWLHYADDENAAGRGDQYLWGRDILIAPVVERNATERSVYLPAGDWFDFWTEQAIAGPREIRKPVTLETVPLFIRAGAVLPMGPVKQWTGEKTTGILSLTIYPGANGSFSLYEDDGISFNYRRGEWQGIDITWTEQSRMLSLKLAKGSKMLEPSPREIQVRILPSKEYKTIRFRGRPISIRL